MSFMFKPLAYDDPLAVNDIEFPEGYRKQITEGLEETALRLVKSCTEKTAGCRLFLDGYVSAQFEPLVRSVTAQLERLGRTVVCIAMEEFYKSEEEIEEITSENLPLNYEDDPVLLFGKIYRGKIDDFIVLKKAEDKLKEKGKDVVILYGLGSLSESLREYADVKVYLDVIPKTAAIRAREAKYRNIGDMQARPFSLLMRRNYFVDFEIVVKLRKDLLRNNILDFYVLNNKDGVYHMADRNTLENLMTRLAAQPFRTKPVYLEGIWGGEFIRKVRKIPEEISGNIAWVFDLIPMEVSVVIDVEGLLFDLPFSTFIQNMGEVVMGQKCVDAFDGYFPIRFNYDDTWHSNGNMSIQVHPDEKLTIEQYDEFGRQDEAYYIVATGHGAKTYCGFKGDGKEFMKLADKAQEDHEDIPYQDYIYSLESIPGRQIMLPAGTIHASGRNQLILELGSLTIGSYTYKVYDYNRKDKDGAVRPIHLKKAEEALHFERDAKWVHDHIAIAPVLLKETNEYKEYLIGKTDLIYYETHRIELNTSGAYEDTNYGQFTVIAIVDGERVKIYSKENPELCYVASFLDVVTIPASIGDYVIEAQGYQPVVVHKTFLKEGYTRYKDGGYSVRGKATV